MMSRKEKKHFPLSLKQGNKTRFWMPSVDLIESDLKQSKQSKRQRNELHLKSNPSTEVMKDAAHWKP